MLITAFDERPQTIDLEFNMVSRQGPSRAVRSALNCLMIKFNSRLAVVTNATELARMRIDIISTNL